MSHQFIIVGTDTGCGKTIVTGLLSHYLTSTHNYRVTTQKFVQTGDTTDNDLAIHDHYAPHLTSFPTQLRCPYTFPAPVSPHFAAKLTNQTINIDRITTSFFMLAKQVDYLICETSGGIMVPYSDTLTQLDILVRLNCPIIVVSANRLGTLNHTILTVNALLFEKLPVCGVILSQPHPDIDPALLTNNEATLRHWLPVPILGTLSHDKNGITLPSQFNSIGNRIYDCL